MLALRKSQNAAEEERLREMLLASGFSTLQISAALAEAHGDMNGAAEVLYNARDPAAPTATPTTASAPASSTAARSSTVK